MLASIQQSPPSLSWMGTTWLSPEEAERELAVLRAKPMLRKDVCTPSPTVTTRGRRTDGPHRGPSSPSRLRSIYPFPAPQRTPSPGGTNSDGCRSAWRSNMSSDQAIGALQVEMEALRTALFPASGDDKSDYRLAQSAMDRLECLENVLWEAHGREAGAATLAATRKMQETHSSERAALEASLQQRRHRLERSCREQVRALQQAHESRLTGLHRLAVPAAIVTQGGGGGGGGDRPGSDNADPTEPHEPPPPTTTTIAATIPETGTAAAPVASAASRASGVLALAEMSGPRRRRRESEAAGGGITPADREREGERAGVVDTKDRAPAAAAAAAAAGSWRANKALVELRSELGRHLAAVAQVLDGGRHLQEATRVMREIDKLEALDRLDSEVKPGGELITSLERTTTTLQKQALAEKVQRDKHERLRRSLECSGAEGLRLLSVRQRGALGRLVVRRRAAKHDRETDLRGSLARVKGGVARLWREHNRRRSRYCGGSGGSGGPRSSGGADAPAAGGGNGLRGAGGGGDRSRPKPSGGPPGGGGGGGGVVDRREDARDTTAVPASAGEVGSSIDRGGEEGEEADGGDAREWRGSGTSSADDENLSASGRRRPGDDRMNPDGTIARASGGTTTAGRGNFEGGTAAATPPAPTSEVNDDKIEETRTASSPGPSSTSSSRRRKAGSKRGGTPWERKNRAVATPGVAAAAAATGTAATAGTEDGAACDGSFGVLSEGELRALAALGRGAPDDPRLLLSTFPLPPPRRRQRPLPSTRARADELEEKEERASESRSGNNGLGTVLLDDGVDGCRAGGGFESAGEDQRTAVEGGACASNAYDEVLLDRAMDKLARKIRADEEMSRRELGMAPLSMSM